MQNTSIEPVFLKTTHLFVLKFEIENDMNKTNKQKTKQNNFKTKSFSLRGETVYVNLLVTVSCSLNISVVYFCN